MIGGIKAEIYKMFHNYYLYSCVGIIFIMHFICNVMISDANRFNARLDYFYYTFLLVINLVVGSMIAGEYRGNMKETILSVRNRRYVMGSKIIVIVVTMTLLFGFYLLGMFQDGVAFDKILMSNQYAAVIQHTLILILCSILLKSFSGLSVGTVIFLCAYKEIGRVNIDTWWGRIVESTFYNQFTSINELQVTIISLVIIVVSLVLTFLLFSKQEIS